MVQDAEDVCSEPWSEKRMATAVRVSWPSASCHPSSTSAASSAWPVCISAACRRLRSKRLEVGAVHHRSPPRSRSRRAMMFRWISALPP